MELLKRFVNESNIEYNKFGFSFNGSSLHINNNKKIKDYIILSGSKILIIN